MKVKFSRHAKRRAKLYEIPESTIEKILIDSEEFNDGKHELIIDIAAFNYPIKIVIAVENDIITVITSYPLKKGRRQ